MNLEVVKFIFLFLIGTTVLNFAIAITARIRTRHREFNDLIHYWAWLFVTFLVAAVLSKNSIQIGLSYFFQLMVSNKLGKMLSSSMGLEFSLKKMLKLQVVGLSLGAWLLLYSNVGFTISLLPVCFVLSIPLVSPVWYSLVKNRHQSNWIEKSMGIIFLTGIINHFNYAFFRLDPDAAWWGWAICIAQYQSLSILLPLAINHRREETERFNLKNVLDKMMGKSLNSTRTDELYRQLEFQISHREELSQQLKITNHNLEEEREMNEILIKTVSHDLANPLTVVNGYLAMIHEGKVGSNDLDRIWERVFQNIQTALGMISRIREAIITRSQASLVTIGPVEILPVVEKLQVLFETRLQEKKLELIIKHQIASDTTVSADENSLLEHILSNILSNAIKFSFEGNEIHLLVKEADDKVMVTIRDFGVGIESHRINSRVFYSTPGTNGESGTGFGMMVMGYFARKFGAHINIESSTLPDKQGTSVTIELNRSAHFFIPAPQNVATSENAFN